MSELFFAETGADARVSVLYGRWRTRFHARYAELGIGADASTFMYELLRYHHGLRRTPPRTLRFGHPRYDDALVRAWLRHEAETLLRAGQPRYNR